VSTFSGFVNPVIQWQLSFDGSTFSDISGANGSTYLRRPTETGVYFYRYSVYENGAEACRFSSNSMRITVIKSPFAQATNYVSGCFGAPVTLFAAGGVSYEWTGPNGFYSNGQAAFIPAVDFSHQGRYIVKVTGQFGCPAYDTTDMVVYYAPVASVAASEFTICEGQSVQLSANSSFSYRWTPTDGLSNTTIPNPVATPTKTTVYTVTVYNQEVTCSDTANVTVHVWSKPVANAGPDKFTYNKKPVLLQGSGTGVGLTYSWSPPSYLDDPQTLSPKANPPQTIIYTLTVSSDYGCGSAQDDMKVEVIDKLFIPSAFTPNNDGLNDTWQLITFDTYPEATVNVYNRWGQLVYSSTGNNYQPWEGRFNGQPVESGTYVYAIRLNKNASVIKGTVSVIR
jgi:gliding motility-associated-like protein